VTLLLEKLTSSKEGLRVLKLPARERERERERERVE
jgi:hypothetical protein